MENNQIIEVRSAINDNVVMTFEHDTSINVVTAGFNKICQLLHINRVQAEKHYYVDVANRKTSW